MTVPGVKAAFERELVTVPLDEILPMRKLPDKVRASVKYRRIAQSVAEVGVIEPLVVIRSPGEGPYMLLDGHVRHAILRELGERETRCLIASDDEAFTYNKRVNRLATIQEHYMIVRALERGVSEEKLARALDVDVRSIKRRRNLLDGVAPEVVELLKDRSVNPVTFEVLRKMKAMRQIEVAELMISAGNFTSAYAKALLAATRQVDLVHADRPKKVGGMTSEQMARMEPPWPRTSRLSRLLTVTTSCTWSSPPATWLGWWATRRLSAICAGGIRKFSTSSGRSYRRRHWIGRWR